MLASICSCSKFFLDSVIHFENGLYGSPLNHNYESQSENNESIFYSTKNNYIYLNQILNDHTKRHARCRYWNPSEFSLFLYRHYHLFHALNRRSFQHEPFVVINFRLTATCLLFFL